MSSRALAVLHFFWMRAGKHNFAEVPVYAAILGALLGWRLVQWLRKRRGAIRARGSGGSPIAAARSPARR